MWNALDGARCKWCRVSFNPTVEPLESHTDDCLYLDGLEALMESDRALFRQHPGATQIIRYVSEFDFPFICYTSSLHICNDMALEVTQVAPGVRERRMVKNCSCDLSEATVLDV